ncbi:MAG: nucleotide sugar dehydrogenase [Planctomycetaceae bacterium]
MKRVAVFGMGYVGCVTAACLGRDGHRVVGVDIDADKVAAVNAGRSPVAEPGLAELLREQVVADRLTATTSVANAVSRTEIGLVAVGTPSSPDGGIDLRAIENVAGEIGRNLRGTDRRYTVVVRSTLLPGLLDERFLPVLEAALGEKVGDRVRLCNNPEFLRETTAIRDYDRPPFVVVGSSEPAWANDVFALYEGIDAPRLTTDARTAAMVKYACNAFHAMKVVFANEIGALARALGADGREVMRIACCDTHLNISPAYLRPGFAFGGSCLPKDVRALTRFAQREAINVDLLDAVLPSNQAHIDRAFRAIRETNHRKIGLVGLSFKADTDDLRESPQVILAETLLGRGFDLRIYDPSVRVGGLVGRNLAYIDHRLPHLAALLVEDPGELYAHAELLVLGTDVAEKIDWKSGFDGPVIDLRCDLVAPPSPVDREAR